MNTKTKNIDRLFKWKTAALMALAVVSLTATTALAGDDEDEFKFNLVSSSPAILPHAQGRVRIESVGPVEIMNVTVWGLPPNTDFDFFVIQSPVAPFGLSWYQGDIETNRYGVGFGGSSVGSVLKLLSWRPALFPFRPRLLTRRMPPPIHKLHLFIPST